MVFRLRHKNKGKGIDEKRLTENVKRELSSYVKQEELREYLENIEKDKRKRELWDSLPAHKKIKVLRYVIEKGVKQHAKKTT